MPAGQKKKAPKGAGGGFAQGDLNKNGKESKAKNKGKKGKEKRRKTPRIKSNSVQPPATACPPRLYHEGIAGQGRERGDENPVLMRVGILRGSCLDFDGDAFQVPFELRQRAVVILGCHLDGLLEVLGRGVELACRFETLAETIVNVSRSWV